MERLLERFAVSLALLLIAAVVATIGLVAIAAAAYLALLGVVTPPLAALLTGVAALLLAVLLLLVGRALIRHRSATQATPGEVAAAAPSTGQLAGEIAGLIGSQVGAFALNSPRATVAISAVIGILLGASPSLRNTLLDFVKTTTGKAAKP
ncbi:MAG TPA: hypothetical protein VM689_03815 [Aliidongia sp.]|nr:hypothetical protein [Aliidongia sp.]